MTFNTFGKNMKRSLWHISHQIEKLKKSNVVFFLFLADSRDIDDPGPFQCRTHNVWTFRFFCRKNYLINWQKICSDESVKDETLKTEDDEIKLFSIIRQTNKRQKLCLPSIKWVYWKCRISADSRRGRHVWMFSVFCVSDIRFVWLTTLTVLTVLYITNS